MFDEYVAAYKEVEKEFPSCFEARSLKFMNPIVISKEVDHGIIYKLFSNNKKLNDDYMLLKDKMKLELFYNCDNLWLFFLLINANYNE